MGVYENLKRLRQEIWSSTIYRRGRSALAKLARPFAIFELAIIYRNDLTAPLGAFIIEPDLQMGQATAEDVERAARTLGRPNPQRTELFRQRLTDGCICFIAQSGPEIVAYVWMRYRSGIDDGDLIDLSPGEVYSFDLFVHENWRGQKIFTALGSQSRLYFKERGYATVYSRVSAFNGRSRKAILRGGWRASGLVLRARGWIRGRWPIVRLWGSAHPLRRRRRKTITADPSAAQRSAGRS
jgi:GNAT superfamily N-acetyltransferase